MSSLAQLREEHAHLVTIVRKLSTLIALDAPPPSTELYALRRELTTTLIGHLKAEDWVLYPRLLASPDAKIARTAREFSEEMGGLAQAYTAYAEKWGSFAIEQDWPGYCRETAGIIEALTNRITRENRDLYPLLEGLDRAA